MELKRELGLTSAVMITVGSVIGSGIFLKPLDVANALPSTGWVYGLWVLLGIVCLCGAFSYAELGAMFPEAGGQYAFLREAWGSLPAFLFGWCYFLVINTGTMSALSVAFTDSLAKLLGVDFPPPVHLSIAAGMVLSLALVNHLGVRHGAALQNVSTFAKIGSLGLIVLAGFAFGEPATPAATAAIPQKTGVAGLVAASVAIFWAYEGWHQLPFSAGELKNPGRHLPLGLIVGVLILVSTYLIVNAAYFHLVPIDEMRAMEHEIDVPTAAVDRIFGSAGAGMLAAMICLSVFGAANPNMLSSSRAFYAMAKDGLAPRAMTRIHRVRLTPVVSIWTQASWAVLLILAMPRFGDLTKFVVFIALIFYALAVASVYVLRARQRARERPHRCVGYPLTPAVFIVAVIFVNAYTLLDPEERRNALKGLGILAAGVPVYLWLARRGVSAEPEEPPGGA